MMVRAERLADETAYALPLHGAGNPSTAAQGTSPGSFANPPDVGGPRGHRHPGRAAGRGREVAAGPACSVGHDRSIGAGRPDFLDLFQGRQQSLRGILGTP